MNELTEIFNVNVRDAGIKLELTLFPKTNDIKIQAIEHDITICVNHITNDILTEYLQISNYFNRLKNILCNNEKGLVFLLTYAHDKIFEEPTINISSELFWSFFIKSPYGDETLEHGDIVMLNNYTIATVLNKQIMADNIYYTVCYEKNNDIRQHSISQITSYAKRHNHYEDYTIKFSDMTLDRIENAINKRVQ